MWSKDSSSVWEKVYTEIPNLLNDICKKKKKKISVCILYFAVCWKCWQKFDLLNENK